MCEKSGGGSKQGSRAPPRFFTTIIAFQSRLHPNFPTTRPQESDKEIRRQHFFRLDIVVSLFLGGWLALYLFLRFCIPHPSPPLSCSAKPHGPSPTGRRPTQTRWKPTPGSPRTFFSPNYTMLSCHPLFFYPSLSLEGFQREGGKDVKSPHPPPCAALPFSIPHSAKRQRAESQPTITNHHTYFIFSCSTHAHRQRLPSFRLTLTGKKERVTTTIIIKGRAYFLPWSEGGGGVHLAAFVSVFL